MKNLIKVFTISFLAINLWSCSKDKEVSAESKTDILVSTPWVINSADFAVFRIYTKGDASSLYDASKISLTFKKDGTITATDQTGAAISGTWAFNADETKITLPPGLPFTEVVVDGISKTNFNVNVPTFTYAVLGSTQTGKLTVKMVPKA